MSHSKFIQPSTTDLPSDVGRSWLRATKTGEPRLIALTFDDGPIPGATEDILNALKVQGWSATFCVLGQQVEEHPGLLRRMVAQGHEVTGHGWSHANLMDIEPDAVRREVLDCLEIIEKVAGLRPRWFRPPFLASNPALRTRIRDEFLCAILDANVDPQDYQHPAPGVLTERLLTDLQDGSVVLFHDWSEQTRAELPGVMVELAKRGYRSVTVSELERSRKTS